MMPFSLSPGDPVERQPSGYSRMRMAFPASENVEDRRRFNPWDAIAQAALRRGAFADMGGDPDWHPRIGGRTGGVPGVGEFEQEIDDVVKRMELARVLRSMFERGRDRDQLNALFDTGNSNVVGWQPTVDRLR